MTYPGHITVDCSYAFLPQNHVFSEKNSIKNSTNFWSYPEFFGVIKFFFGVILDKSEKCSELSNTTPKIFRYKKKKIIF